MDTLATILRAAQLYAHAAHNGAKGPTFFADHEFLGELYPAYEAAYDKVIERSIGLGEPVDLAAIGRNAAIDAARYSDPMTFSTAQSLQVLMDYERKICAEVDRIFDETSTGTQNRIAQIADDSEDRQYQIGQRLK
jgi:DNA-binding ferritin-like protein